MSREPEAESADRTPQSAATDLARGGGWHLPLAVICATAIFFAVDWTVLSDPGYLVTESPSPLLYIRAARNFDRYGEGELGIVPMITYGERTRAEFQFLPHHPPLLSLMLYGVQSAVGFGPLSGRVFMLACWILTAAGVFALGRRIAGVWGAWTACLLTLLAPGTLREGLVVEVTNGPVILFTALTVLAYAAYRDRSTMTRFALLLALSLLTTLSDWQGLLAAGFITLDRWAGDRKLRDPVSLLPIASLAAVFGWTRWAHHVSEGTRVVSPSGLGGEDVLGTLASRINEGPVYIDQERIGALDGAWQATRYALGEHCGWAAAVLAIAGLVFIVTLILRGRADARWRLALLLFMITWTYGLIFSRAAIIHRFWTLAMIPGVAVLAGVGVAAIHATLARRAPAFGRILTGLVLATAVGLGAWQAQWRWDLDLPTIRAEERRAVEVAGAVSDLLGPRDALLRAGTGLRHDLLALLLDRPVFGNIGSAEVARELIAGGEPPLVAALFGADAARFPLLALELAQYPFTMRQAGAEPLVIFDLRSTPALRDTLPSSELEKFRALAAVRPAPSLAIRNDPASEATLLDIASPYERHMLFVGTLAEDLAPLHEFPADRPIPLSRLPSGSWNIAAAGIVTDSASGARELSAMSPPLALQIPLAPGYVRNALVTLALTLGLCSVAYAAAAYRRRDSCRPPRGAGPGPVGPID